jgi:hypothetical protein
MPFRSLFKKSLSPRKSSSVAHQSESRATKTKLRILLLLRKMVETDPQYTTEVTLLTTHHRLLMHRLQSPWTIPAKLLSGPEMISRCFFRRLLISRWRKSADEDPTRKSSIHGIVTSRQKTFRTDDTWSTNRLPWPLFTHLPVPDRLEFQPSSLGSLRQEDAWKRPAFEIGVF